MWTKHLCVLIQIRSKGGWYRLTCLSPSSDFVLLTVLLLWIFLVIYVSCLSQPCGKDWPLGSLVYCVFLCLFCCYFSLWSSGSCMILNCIDSWYLPSYLHSKYISILHKSTHTHITTDVDNDACICFILKGRFLKPQIRVKINFHFGVPYHWRQRREKSIKDSRSWSGYW